MMAQDKTHTSCLEPLLPCCCWSCWQCGGEWRPVEVAGLGLDMLRWVVVESI
jgi:hypothetical protein